MTEQPVVFVHGTTDAAATAAALAIAGWGRGRQAIPGGKPTWSGRVIVAGEDETGRLLVAAGRGPGASSATRLLAAVFGLAGLQGRLVLHDAETGYTTELGPPAVGDGPAIIYVSRGSPHAALVAAAVHTGQLPADRVPSWRELRSVPVLHAAKHATGEAIFLGSDHGGRAVYALGTGVHDELLRRLVRRTLRKLLPGPPPVLIVSTNAIDPFLRAGTQIAGSWAFTGLGLPLIRLGLRRTYEQLARVAEATVRELSRIQTGRAAGAVDHGQAIRHTGWQELQRDPGSQRPT